MRRAEQISEGVPRGFALVSAVLDALSPLGVEDIEMPVTPLRVWNAIQDAKPA